MLTPLPPPPPPQKTILDKTIVLQLSHKINLVTETIDHPSMRIEHS